MSVALRRRRGTLDVPFQLILFVSRLLEASGLRVGLFGGSASSPGEVPG